MYRATVVIIGAGQAGLAVSHLLTEASVDHVILERGNTAESWRSQRWDSLRLLTPNWMSRLPGWAYRGPDPDGFMSARSVVDYLGRYAVSFRAPVVKQAQVRSVGWTRGRFLVDSDAGSWTADSVVVATGYCHEPAVPPSPAVCIRPSASSPRTATGIRTMCRDGAVLVVGGSATGVQLADELAADGRAVTLAVGRHTRVPRRYRGVDIMRWLNSMGLLDRPIRPADATEASRRCRSSPTRWAGMLICRCPHVESASPAGSPAGTARSGRPQAEHQSKVWWSSGCGPSPAAAPRFSTEFATTPPPSSST